jgi:hypothetical protein
MSGLWPLRNTPRDCEPVAFWVRRLAAEYALDYKTFCRKALHLSGTQIRRLNFEIPEAAVKILSEGTGVTHERIEEMTLPRIMERIQKLVKGYERKDPVGSREIRQRMIEDAYAVACRPRKEKPKPKRKRRATRTKGAKIKRGAAWNCAYMETERI